jgi:hypothetical protein
MIIVWRYLIAEGESGVDETELARLLRPPSLQRQQSSDEEDSAGTMVNQVLTELRALGLIKRDKNGKVTPNVPTHDDADDTFLEFVEQRLLNPERAEKCGQGRIPAALAWFLLQDPTQPLTWGRNYQANIEVDCGPDVNSFDLTNAARFQQFVYWARYLGFAWRLELQGVNVVFPDPTAALTRHLPTIAGKKGRMPIQDVINKLAQLLPVLEGGTARLAVESYLSQEKRRPAEQLSRSTSMALECLELLGRLVLERLADAPAINLDSFSGLRAVSHVTWKDREKL